MSTANLNINPAQTGLSYTSDLNAALSAIDSNHSGSAEPTNQVVSGKFWLNTSGTNPVLNIYRGGAVSPWKPLFTITTTGVSTSLTALTVSGTSSLGVISGSSVSVTGAISGASVSANSVSATGNITAADFNTTSDSRLKENIVALNSKTALEKVCQLRGVNYTMNNKFNVGLIAQETEKVIPEVVIEREDGYKGISYSNLVGYLVEAIKAQEEKILILEEKIKHIGV